MRRREFFAAIAVAALLAGQHATAQSNYPYEPVRLIVAAGPGGSGDLLGRALAHKLTELWGQQVVIDNRPGAGTVIGTTHRREVRARRLHAVSGQRRAHHQSGADARTAVRHAARLHAGHAVGGIAQRAGAASRRCRRAASRN